MHLRNKVQEIHGAILPLAEKYKWNNSYFPYETLVAAFAAEEIDIRFDESTSLHRIRNSVDARK